MSIFTYIDGSFVYSGSDIAELNISVINLMQFRKFFMLISTSDYCIGVKCRFTLIISLQT